MTTDLHEPSPEFARFLEWQVTSAARRQDRFDVPDARSGLRKYVGVAVLAVVSMLVGAAGVTASDRMQDNRQTEVLLTQQRAEIQLAELQVQLAREAVEQAKQRVAVGVMTPQALADAEAALAQATARLERTQLDIDEVRRSGRPVQDDVTAPVVGARDYVADRLRLELRSAVSRLDISRQRAADARTRRDVGLARDLEVRQAELEMLRDELAIRALQERLELRRKFVDGDLSAQAATNERLRMMTESQLRLAEMELNLATERLAAVQKQIAVGMADPVGADALRAQLEVVQKRADVAKLRERLELLKRGKSAAGAGVQPR